MSLLKRFSTFRLVSFICLSLLFQVMSTPLAASDKEKPSIAVLLSSVREERKGDLVGKFISQELQKRGYQVILIDPKEYNLPLLDKRLRDYKDQQKAPKNLIQLSELLRKADGYLVVSAIYNGSVPPALKNLIDHFGSNEFKGKPVGIITYSPGKLGGVQVVSAWRDIFPVLGAITLPYTLSIPQVDKTITSDGKSSDEQVHEHLEGLIQQLDWYATALKNQRAIAPDQ